MNEAAFVEKRAVDIVKQMQRLANIDGIYDTNHDPGQQISQRRTIHNIERNRTKAPAIGTLDVAFRRRFLSIGKPQEGEGK